jgi:hypothetical protein
MRIIVLETARESVSITNVQEGMGKRECLVVGLRRERGSLGRKLVTSRRLDEYLIYIGTARICWRRRS